MPFEYQRKSEKQLKNSFNSRVRKKLNSFKDFAAFYKWYGENELKCHYCKLTEMESQKISMEGILTSRRFPSNGMIAQGRSRAVWLEVDRINPAENYSEENCVLCCYFCNNDKSDVFNGTEYIQFFQNRVTYLRQLIKNWDKENI